MLFLGVQKVTRNGDFFGFFDINRLLEVIKGSNLVQNDRNTPPDSLEAKNFFWPKMAIFGTF